MTFLWFCALCVCIIVVLILSSDDISGPFGTPCSEYQGYVTSLAPADAADPVSGLLEQRDLGDRDLDERDLGDRDLDERDLGDRDLGDRDLGDMSSRKSFSFKTFLQRKPSRAENGDAKQRDAAEDDGKGDPPPGNRKVSDPNVAVEKKTRKFSFRRKRSKSDASKMAPKSEPTRRKELAPATVTEEQGTSASDLHLDEIARRPAAAGGDAARVGQSAPPPKPRRSAVEELGFNVPRTASSSEEQNFHHESTTSATVVTSNRSFSAERYKINAGEHGPSGHVTSSVAREETRYQPYNPFGREFHDDAGRGGNQPEATSGTTGTSGGETSYMATKLMTSDASRRRWLTEHESNFGREGAGSARDVTSGDVTETSESASKTRTSSLSAISMSKKKAPAPPPPPVTPTAAPAPAVSTVKPNPFTPTRKTGQRFWETTSKPSPTTTTTTATATTVSSPEGVSVAAQPVDRKSIILNAYSDRFKASASYSDSDAALHERREATYSRGLQQEQQQPPPPQQPQQQPPPPQPLQQQQPHSASQRTLAGSAATGSSTVQSVLTPRGGSTWQTGVVTVSVTPTRAAVALKSAEELGGRPTPPGADERFLTCAICKGDLKSPKLLPCVHTFCADCLDNVMGIQRLGGGGYLECPTCEERVVVPRNRAEGFKDNQFVVGLQELMMAGGDRCDERPRFCEICVEGRMPVTRCAVCREHMCAGCSKAHRKMKATKRHELVDVTSLPVAPTSAQHAARRRDLEGQVSATCAQHGEPVTLYCTTCEVPGCIRCTVATHNGHKTKEISVVAAIKRRTIQEALRLFEEKTAELRRLAAVPAELEAGLEEHRKYQAAAIEERRLELVYALCRAADNLQAELQSRTRDAAKVIHLHRDDCQGQMGPFESAAEFCRKLLKHGSHRDLVQLEGYVVSRIAAMDARLRILREAPIEDYVERCKLRFESGASGMIELKDFLGEVRVSSGPAPDIAAIGRAGQSLKGTKATSATEAQLNMEPLHCAFSPWVPYFRRNVSDVAPDVRAGEDFVRAVRGALNQVTLAGLSTHVSNLAALQITTEARLECLAGLLVTLACSDVRQAALCALMCRCLSFVQVPSVTRAGDRCTLQAFLNHSCLARFEASRGTSLFESAAAASNLEPGGRIGDGTTSLRRNTLGRSTVGGPTPIGRSTLGRSTQSMAVGGYTHQPRGPPTMVRRTSSFNYSTQSLATGGDRSVSVFNRDPSNPFNRGDEVMAFRRRPSGSNDARIEAPDAGLRYQFQEDSFSPSSSSSYQGGSMYLYETLPGHGRLRSSSTLPHGSRMMTSSGAATLPYPSRGYGSGYEDAASGSSPPPPEEILEETAAGVLERRRRNVGVVTFLCELFKVRLITENLLHDWIHKLSHLEGVSALECLCLLLHAVGRDLDREQSRALVSKYFAQLGQLLIRKAPGSGRAAAMVKDLMELRTNDWHPLHGLHYWEF